MYQNGFSSDEEEPIQIKPNGGGVILVTEYSSLFNFIYFGLNFLRSALEKGLGQ